MKRITLLLISLTFLVFSCKRTVEGEKNAFNSNVKDVKSLALDFPSFKSVIDEQVTKAEAAFKESENISNEEQKIAKMAEANSLLTSGFIYDLKKVKSMKTDVQSKIGKIKGLTLKDNDRSFAYEMINQANQTITTTNNMLMMQVMSIADAEVAAKKGVNELDLSLKNLDKIISSNQTQNNQTNNQNNNQNNQNNNQNNQTTVKTVKCEYCATENESANSNCKNCAAPLKK